MRAYFTSRTGRCNCALNSRPGSDWALQDLSKALSAQGKQAEAPAVNRDVERSWALADTGLRAVH